MPELKKNFTRGRMNKDLDERLVPNGEYRDALNIQIATTEGSDIGSAQTLLSNVQLTDWITSGQNAFFTNVPKASNFTESDIMTRSHAKAETIIIIKFTTLYQKQIVLMQKLHLLILFTMRTVLPQYLLMVYIVNLMVKVVLYIKIFQEK